MLSTAGVYLFVAFVAMQVVNDVVPFIPFVRDAEEAGQVVLLLLVIGFPIAMTAAWVLELQPPRLRRELPREEAELRERAGPAKELRPDTVGVLPFENLSDEREDEYFSDGITDDVMMSLSQIEGLRVIPRTTVRQYKSVSRGSAELGAELGAATLVTGSVRRIGSRARVVVVAIDAASEDHLWSDTYDRELEDIFEVQSEIASHVAEAVARELSPAARRRIEERGTSDAEAYVLYLRARFLWNQRTEKSLVESLSLF
ncbi:MAG: hypothetical protein OEN56_12875, partial [Gemmatimonadota bacterium]|nr:hypothetical protein [Gemmatimonadota bacterium]